MTHYIVLTQASENDSWELYGQAEAPNPETAVAMAAQQEARTNPETTRLLESGFLYSCSGLRVTEVAEGPDGKPNVTEKEEVDLQEATHKEMYQP